MEHVKPDEEAQLRALPIHDARALCNDDGQALIRLDGRLYSLRITRQKKLILTK